MDRIEATLRRLVTALDSDTYDIGVLADRSMFPRLEALPPSRIFHMLSYLKYRNVHGGNLYFRHPAKAGSPCSTISPPKRWAG